MNIDKDELMYRIKENKLAVYLLVGFIVLIIVLFAFKPSAEEDAGKDVVSMANKYQKIEKEIESDFSVLNVSTNSTTYQNRPVVSYDLYLKNPFITTEQYNYDIQKFIDLVKWKYSNPDNNVYLSAVSINVYDRKILFDRGVLPRDFVTYALDSVLEDDTTMKDVYDNSKNPKADMIEYSSRQKDVPDYSKYVVKQSFTPMESSEDNPPLTDDEVLFLLKIMDYNILQNRDITETSISIEKLLLWEYGLDTSNYEDITNKDLQEYSISIGITSQKDVEKLMQRFIESYNNKFSLYPENESYYKSVYRNSLIVKYPKLVNYLVNNHISKTNLDAKKQLIKTPVSQSLLEDFNSDNKSYLQIFIDDAIEKLNSVNMEASDENVSNYINSESGNLQDFKENKNKNKNSIVNNDDVTKETKKSSETNDSTKNKETKNKNKESESNAFSDENVK